ncbi:bifunctional ornithine acetyltransferase/N-acetylglutamate synthase [Tissierella creatinophila]|uniref:Arginine biosynthesis bifunctional protein ArgJ n=1 Tax=Tissierella creatinophila DSM 6911 TaxID=1123403 RepID=A0A1U7M5B5_TISCR|nr:bifunctional ornithine acetyltransferase/N-acetylglutamate synthase [Tissierella creatinophila]OLS02514.1 arginine biosynthesis bifunctional protein ArgJ [Tissierella creatinophila DSM 6911]
MKIINGGITTPKGFKAAGFFAAIRKKKNDMSIIYSDVPADCVAVFTKNTVKAAPVQIDMEILKRTKLIQAIVINSGNANACTGKKGLEDAQTMIDTVKNVLGLEKDRVLVSSTGVIGVNLPIEKIKRSIEENYKEIGDSLLHGDMTAEAIMTTDTFPKKVAVEVEIDGKKVVIAGIAKGSGMIHPNMGTMLAFVTTDVNISHDLLDELLKQSTDDSYNMISVDGDTSTNDTLIVLANKMAENKEITTKDEDYYKFKEAFDYVNLSLAKQIIKDGEGAGKFIEANVKGAKTKDDAREFAKSVISSSLVKAAFFGEDANWGRIICALGYTEIDFQLEKSSINIQNGDKTIVLMKDGMPLDFDEEKALEVLKMDEIKINIELGEGTESATAWGCDLSYDYVKINASYRS